ncbi:MAG: hypothetical protein IT463_01370 [Planctomycetes bacterium]|nr:hypothetical protein [Planctomycetota bacterium]
MMRRVLALAGAMVREAVRSRATLLLALALLLAVPLAVAAGEAGSQAWLGRLVTVEALRTVLPLAVVTGSAFLLRPGLKRGWVVLPARRGEWYTATALAALGIVTAALALLVGGALLAAAWQGDSAQLRQARGAASLHGPRGAVTGAERAWAEPRPGQELVFEFAGAEPGETLTGELEFELAWTQAAPPSRATPLRLFVSGDKEHEAEVRSEARRRVSFRAPNPGGKVLRLRVMPADPVLLVGARLSDLRVTAGHSGHAGSLLLLGLLSLGACACGLAVVLFTRTLATAPTAALAGVLALASLTLLPATGGTGAMARERRVSVEQAGAEEPGTLERAQQVLAALPELVPAAPCDEYLRGYTGRSGGAADGAWRLFVGLALLPLGWLTFSRRQLAA